MASYFTSFCLDIFLFLWSFCLFEKNNITFQNVKSSVTTAEQWRATARAAVLRASQEQAVKVKTIKAMFTRSDAVTVTVTIIVKV